MMAECGSSEEAPDISLPSETDTVFDIFCSPCISEGKHVEAGGYCSDCCEHFCGQCITQHKKFSISKHHNIVSKEDMPKNVAARPYVDFCSKKCQMHVDEIIKYFCPSHNILGCSACVTLKHRMCEYIVFVPEVATDFQDSQEFKEFQTRIKRSIERSQDIIESANKSLKSSAECYAKVLQEIETFRKRINTTLDMLEDQIKQKASETTELDSDSLKAMKTESDRVRRQLQSISSDLEGMKKDQQFCHMFIHIKLNNSKLEYLEEKLKTLHDKNTFPYFEFIPNERLQLLMEATHCLGKIGINDSKKMGIFHVADIEVSSPSDKTACCITGAALMSQDKLVIVDMTNSSVKLIDTMNYSILSEVHLKSNPWDVTAICDCKVAVTLPKLRKIAFLKSKDNELLFEKAINVNGTCRGVVYDDDKLFVAFDIQNKVEIVDMAGKPLRKILRKQSFDQPTYIALSNDCKSLYISNWNDNKVMKLNKDGEIVAVYRDAELTHACKMVVSKAGWIYICGGLSSNVHFITQHCEKISVLLTEADGIKYPRAISFCEATKRLYVAMKSTNNVKVFQVYKCI